MGVCDIYRIVYAVIIITIIIIIITSIKYNFFLFFIFIFVFYFHFLNLTSPIADPNRMLAHRDPRL